MQMNVMFVAQNSKRQSSFMMGFALFDEALVCTCQSWGRVTIGFTFNRNCVGFFFLITFALDEGILTKQHFAYSNL